MLDEDRGHRGRVLLGGIVERRPSAYQVAVEGTVVATQYHGASTRLDVALEGGPVLVVDRTNDGSGERLAAGGTGWERGMP